MECFVVEASGYRFERSGASMMVYDQAQFKRGIQYALSAGKDLNESPAQRYARYGVLERVDFLVPGDDPARAQEFFFIAIADWLAQHRVLLPVAS